MSEEATAAASADGEPAAPIAEPSRSRRRGVIALLVAVGLLAVLAIAAVVAESLARQHAEALIAEELRASLNLAPDHPVAVRIDGPPVLIQAAGGRLESVEVTASDVAFGELVGELRLVIVDTPLDTTQPTRSVQAVYRVAERDVAALAGFFAGAIVSDVQLDDREIRFQSGFSFFGIEFSVGIGVTPAAVDGGLAFTPTSVLFNEQRIEVADLRRQFGPLVAPLFETRQFCVAQYLPADLSLAAVEVGDQQLRLVFEARNSALGGPGFSTRGSCA